MKRPQPATVSTGRSVQESLVWGFVAQKMLSDYIHLLHAVDTAVYMKLEHLQNFLFSNTVSPSFNQDVFSPDHQIDSLFLFSLLTIIPIDYGNILLNNFIAEIWGCCQQQVSLLLNFCFLLWEKNVSKYLHLHTVHSVCEQLSAVNIKKTLQTF